MIVLGVCAWFRPCCSWRIGECDGGGESEWGERPQFGGAGGGRRGYAVVRLHPENYISVVGVLPGHTYYLVVLQGRFPASFALCLR